MLPPLTGVLAMWLLVSGSMATLALEPLAVSRTGVSPGMGDLMRLVHVALRHFLSGSIANNLGYVVALIASAGYALFLASQDQPTRQREAGALAIASLLFFPHLVYDFVFLIVPIASCLAGPLNRTKAVVLSGCSVILYGYRVLPILGFVTAGSSISIVIFFVLLGTLVAFGRKEIVNSHVAGYEKSLP
jgi:hypothetical protein